jgi:hypothetical protein
MVELPPYHDDDEFEPGGNGGSQTSVVFVSTQQTVELSVDEIDDDRTPDGMVCMGVFFQDRLIARSIVPPEALDQIEDQEVFSGPVRLGLAAVEEDPGLQCRLFALLPASRFHEHSQEPGGEPDEPWAASVPRFEDLMQNDQEIDMDDDEENEDAVVPLLLGHVVRFGRDRRHPDSLAEEAADVLRAILADDRPLTNIVDKIIEDL